MFGGQLQQADLQIHQPQKLGLCAPFQSTHPSVVAGGADVLDDKTAQTVASKKFVPGLIFIMKILFEAEVRLFNFYGKPLGKDMFARTWNLSEGLTASCAGAMCHTSSYRPKIVKRSTHSYGPRAVANRILRDSRTLQGSPGVESLDLCRCTAEV